MPPVVVLSTTYAPPRASAKPITIPNSKRIAGDPCSITSRIGHERGTIVVRGRTGRAATGEPEMVRGPCWDRHL
jgi:hypothetical protein